MQNHDAQTQKTHKEMRAEWGEVTQERAQFEIESAEQQCALTAMRFARYSIKSPVSAAL